MLVESRSLLSGLIRTIGLPASEEQIEKWENGTQIIEAMPNLSPTQHKFLMKTTFDLECSAEPYEYYSD
jgi:hypothetical protein